MVIPVRSSIALDYKFRAHFNEWERKYQLFYIRTIGPTALAIEDQQVSGHGKVQHADGFGSPTGAVTGWEIPLEDCGSQDLADRGWLVGQIVEIQFESGVAVHGRLLDQVFHETKLCLLSFTDCTVEDNRTGEIYFKPSWGRYDMVVGSKLYLSIPAQPISLPSNLRSAYRSTKQVSP